jgi:predicted nucleic acid-binding protein
MTVIDASLVYATIVDKGELGEWARTVIRQPHLAAPHILPAEVANALRRSETDGSISKEAGALSMRDLVDLPVQLFPFEPLAGRVWELRANLSAYDAWYVALAESLEAELITLDRRLAGAPGPRCSFVLPE